MKIDKKKKELYISVRELAHLSESQTLNQSSSLPRRLKSVIGTEAHQDYQKEALLKKNNIKNEYYIKFEMNINSWSVYIRGRADVVYEENHEIVIEEIKSSTAQVNIENVNQLNPIHVIQLQLYAHYFLMQQKKVRAYLVLYHLLSDEYQKFQVSVEDKADFITKQCKLLLEFYKEEEKVKQNLRNRAKSIVFPFKHYRPHQENIINHVLEGIKNKDRLLLLAHSGLGKTVGTLYPSLKYTLKHNLRLFITTSKTTQQKIYLDTLKLMAKKGGDFRAIILTAKEKICNNTEFLCDPNFCPFLQNYSEKPLDLAITELLKKKVIDYRAIKKEANKIVVCAFELSLDVSLDCDVIIGDYNYIFHPFIRLRRFFDNNYADSMLIIDEVHNLSSRAIDYYSPELSLKDILFVKKFLRSSKTSKKIKSIGSKLLQSLYQFVMSFEEDIENYNKWRAGLVSIKEKKITSFHKNYDTFLIEYIREFSHTTKAIPNPTDPIILFGEKLKYFLTILKESKSSEFSHLYYSDEGVLKIFCKSAANKLSKQIKGFHSVVAQSATLYPLKYYQKMIGFPENSVKLEFSSPFPKENQLHLIYPHISTQYQVRKTFYGNVAELLFQAIKCRKGNYLAFFPSFSFLMGIYYELIKYQLPFDLLVQEKEMKEKKRRSYLRKLKQKNQQYLLLGVHGGIFSEGVDFLGDMAIGAFIIGPGLPAYTFERELMKQYYEENWNKGFEYAYRNPGMNRVIQAAGRIFRSAEDVGIVVLIGSRFKTPYYSNVLPKSWDLIISSKPIEEISNFWRINQIN